MMKKGEEEIRLLKDFSKRQKQGEDKKKYEGIFKKSRTENLFILV